MKKAILMGITGIEVIVMVLAVSAMDSEHILVPVIALLQAVVWIALFAAANPEIAE